MDGIANFFTELLMQGQVKDVTSLESLQDKVNQAEDILQQQTSKAETLLEENLRLLNLLHKQEVTREPHEVEMKSLHTLCGSLQVQEILFFLVILDYSIRKSTTHFVKIYL